MANAWSVEQVLALAPDPASAKAGQSLSSTKKWVTLGSSEEALWGECQGSGAAPYQAKVALDDPAFHCSCPSRKFPCKHTLGLFLLWAADPSALGQADPPDWVASWLEGRSQRAEKKEQKKKEREEKGEPAVDPVAQKKRENARSAKVTTGLDDLALWIKDLVRLGLASVQSKPGSLWEDQARRLIDAQAPGLARRLRQIADLPMSGDGWQGAHLERLASLHLAVEGHRRLESLPDGVQANLRAVIGFAVDQDKVRAEAGVCDVWQVVGQRIEVEDRLRARRTWLVGRDSGRVALILDFAHGSNQPLDASLPVGGSVAAELAFFPGTGSLRALVKERQGPLEPFDTPTAHATLASAYDAYARTLANNPWLERYPIVVKDVILQHSDNSWELRDTNNAVLRVPPRFVHGWRLLGLSGGHPLLLSGEYDGTFFEPLACWIGNSLYAFLGSDEETPSSKNEFLDAAPELSTLWRDVSASALVGVERRPPPSPPSSTPFAQASSTLDHRESSTKLLDLAAAVALYGRVGYRPPQAQISRPDPCVTEDLLECLERPARRLQRLLDGEHSHLLGEWLSRLAEANKRVPSGYLAELLNVARRQSDLRPALRPTLGARGRWLAAINPDWSFVGGDADQGDPEAIWQTGTRTERLLALQTLRATNPAGGLALVMTTWSNDPADDRSAFVPALQTGLSAADEPFLEAALDDRGKSVRRAAAELLLRLPDSALCQRMIDRALALRTATGIEPPTACDAAMVRDGIERKPPFGTGERAWWFKQVASSVPPAVWCRDSSDTPDSFLKQIREGEWGDVLWPSCAVATVRLRSPEWAVALLNHLPKTENVAAPFTTELIDILPAADRDRFLLDRLDSDTGPLRAEHPALAPLQRALGPLGIDLAREVVERVRQVVVEELAEIAEAQGAADSLQASARPRGRRYDYELQQFITTLSRLLPLELLAEVKYSFPTETVPGAYLAGAYAQFLKELRFRHEMHQEFAP